VTNREGFVLAAQALPGNLYDGHTLACTVEQMTAITDTEPAHIHVDKGYRRHDYTHLERVFLSGQRHGLTSTIKKELRRCSGIEPMIGHMQSDGRLDRNYPLGSAGYAINALLVAAGHNLRLFLAHLRRHFVWLWPMLLRGSATAILRITVIAPA
jgi:IS5 family transposase